MLCTLHTTQLAMIRPPSLRTGGTRFGQLSKSEKVCNSICFNNLLPEKTIIKNDVTINLYVVKLVFFSHVFSYSESRVLINDFASISTHVRKSNDVIVETDITLP